MLISSLKNGDFVNLTTDAWSNVKNEPVVNYMAVNPENSLFVEMANTERQGHDANWITQDLKGVMESLQCNVSSTITDNKSANKNELKIPNEKFPSQLFHGCISHGFNLLVKDIFSATKIVPLRVSEDPASFPDDYPFEDLLEFVLSCKEVVTFFHNHHVLRAKLKAACELAKLRDLVRMEQTLWGTTQKQL